MKRKQYTPEQIVKLLREVEAGQAQGKSVEEMCRQFGIADSSYHRRKAQYGGMKTDDVRRLKELERENDRLKQIVAELTLTRRSTRRRPGELTDPAQCREVVGRVCRDLDLSVRRVCKALGVARSVVRYRARLPDKDKELVSRMRELARKHPRFGYRRVAALLRAGGLRANTKRVQRLWTREGLKIPRKVRKKRRLGHDGNGSSRRRAVRVNRLVAE